MYDLTITIPTTGRPTRLHECVKSIDYNGSLFLHIGCKKDNDVLDFTKTIHRNTKVFSSNMDVVSVQTHLAGLSSQKSHILPISDDVVFLKDSIQRAVDFLVFSFPDSDGVVGFNVVNMKSSPYAFMLVGSRYFNNSLKRELFHNGYKHFFADTELGRKAESQGKFKVCHGAMVVHYHPESGAPKDETHTKNRLKKWEHDDVIYQQRIRFFIDGQKQ